MDKAQFKRYVCILPSAATPSAVTPSVRRCAPPPDNQRLANGVG